MQGGAEIYAAACQSCHMPGGVGAQGGAGTKNYPALAGNPRLQSPQYPLTFILNGAGAMPSFNRHLTDEQIAAVVNYLRHDLNDFEGDTAASDVAPLRDGARKTNLGDDAG
ncbi:c-type cytochrome [Deinococcus lacus]|uniref:C-type cytochrome n=1 Tax=Deinococcus lacus TaxID=392561 RepID=A0ABW1YHW0_9DEIO